MAPGDVLITREDLLAIESMFKDASWATLGSDRWSRFAQRSLTDQAFQIVIDNIKGGLSGFDQHSVVNWTMLAECSKATRIQACKIADLFRPSCNRDRLEFLERCLVEVALHRRHESYRDNVHLRVGSWIAYLGLFRRAAKEQERLVRRLTRVPGWTFWLLVRLEEAFEDRLAPIELSMLDSESTAEAVSFLLTTCRHAGRSFDFGNLDENLAHSGVPFSIGSAIIDGHALRTISAQEPFIFRMNFTCVEINHWFLVGPVDDRIGMALEYGYIRTSFRQALFTSDDSAENAWSFKTLCNDIYTRVGAEMCNVTTVGRRRLQLIQEPAECRFLGENILLNDSLFQEERREVLIACYEMTVPPEDLLNLRLTASLSVLDVLKISRVLRFIGNMRWLKLKEIKDTDPIAHTQSTIACMSKRSAVEALCAYGVERKMADEFLGLMSWPSSSMARLDVQYTPLLEWDNAYVFPFRVLTNSNILRNAMYVTRKRPDADGSANWMSRRLKSICEARQISAWTGVEYAHGGVSGELDILFLLGDTLYVLECKNSLLPCSAFELQTVWDYLAKAADQLERFAACWHDRTFRIALSTRLAIDPDGIRAAQTCVVLGTRLLTGIHVHGQPVRAIHDIANFLETGQATLRAPEETPIDINLWEGSSLSSDRLDRYLSEQDRFSEVIWKAFERSVQVASVGAARLKVSRFGLDNRKHLELLIESGIVDGDDSRVREIELRLLEVGGRLR